MHELENIIINFKSIIFYGSYIVFPLIIFCIYKYKNWNALEISHKIVLIIFTLLSIIFIDARFIEPNYISIQNTKITIWLEKKVKIALLADIHLWIYSDEKLLEQTVHKINKIKSLDYVFIAWDLTYFDNSQVDLKLDKLFSSLKDIQVPIYWTLWNHDVEQPWPKVREKLITVFNKYWTHYLNNDIVELDWFTLVWLWSNWWGEDDISLLEQFKEDDKVIVLMHNPDTTLKYKNQNADLTLCGHTHGWQIKIPYLYKKVIPTEWDFDEWLTQEENTQLFITSWLWVVWLPFRFLNPPVIDILEIH